MKLLFESAELMTLSWMKVPPVKALLHAPWATWHLLALSVNGCWLDE